MIFIDVIMMVMILIIDDIDGDDWWLWWRYQWEKKTSKHNGSRDTWMITLECER